MNRIYILCAGASLGLRFDTNLVESIIPPYGGLMSDGFFYYAKRFEQEILTSRKKLDPDTLLDVSNIQDNQWVKDYLRENDLEEDIEKIFKDKEFSGKVNVEALLNFMENKSEEENEKEKDEATWIARRVADLASVFSPVHSIIYSAIKMVSFYCYSPLYRKFVREIIQEGDNIITFNWDDLLEEELYAASNWDYWDGYGFKVKGVKRQGDSVYTLPPRGLCSKNLIFKPHGSMNWYRKRPSQLVDDSIYVWIAANRSMRGQGHYSQQQCESVDYQNQAGVYFTPPGERKDMRFPEIWKQIRSQLETADELIFIGFAFNEYDVEAEQFFQDVTYRNDVRILIVNPDHLTESRYASIFQRPVLKICSTFGEYVNYYKEMGYLQNCK